MTLDRYLKANLPRLPPLAEIAEAIENPEQAKADVLVYLRYRPEVLKWVKTILNLSRRN